MLVDLKYADIELIRSALQYYGTGTPYAARRGNERQQQRATRALLLARDLGTKYPSTIDEDGSGNSVKVFVAEA